MTIALSGMSRDTFNDGVSSLRLRFLGLMSYGGNGMLNSGVRDGKSLRNMILNEG
jgi:hypothetical protein